MTLPKSALRKCTQCGRNSLYSLCRTCMTAMARETFGKRTRHRDEVSDLPFAGWTGGTPLGQRPPMK